MSSVRPQGERCPGGAGASANIINVTTAKQAERFGLTRGRGAAGWTTTSRRQRKHRRLCSGRTNEAGGHKLQEPRTCSRANSATAIPQPQPAAAAANAAKARESEAWRAIQGLQRSQQITACTMRVDNRGGTRRAGLPSEAAAIHALADCMSCDTLSSAAP